MQIWRSYSSSAPVPLIDPSYLCMKKTSPCDWRGRGNGPDKSLPANTNMKLCLTVGQTRGVGGLCLRTIPGPRELWGPEPHPTFRWVTHLLGSPVSSVNDLRSVSQLLSQCWGPTASTPHEGLREREAGNRDQGHLGLVCPLSLLGNDFLGSARKFELLENGRPLPLQIKFLWSSAYSFPGSVLNSDVVLPRLGGPFPLCLRCQLWAAHWISCSSLGCQGHTDPRLHKGFS